MNTTYKVYDKIRALAGDWEMYRNGIKWNTVFYMGDIVRGRIEKTNYDEQYFTIESLENNNTVTFTKGSSSAPANTFYYSLDDGATWTSSNDTISWTLQSGGRLKLKATANAWSIGEGYDLGSWIFSSTNRYNVYGNIMSLLYGDNFTGQTTLSNNFTFGHLFYNSSNLINASKLVLPATTLAKYCYLSMFGNCTSLIAVPELKATTLTIYCYNAMFTGCTSLTTAPALNATTLTAGCYSDMFYGCTSLTTAPELKATTLAERCYQYMFCNCTSLNTAPELKATTLAESCYQGMFKDCTSLTTAPELKATTLTQWCYNEMFMNCTNLNYIKCLATNISANGCLRYWVNGVAVSGTFIKAASMNSWVTATNENNYAGIPSGWTVQNAS